MACSATRPDDAKVPAKFKLVTSVNDALARFDLRLVSRDYRPLCLTAEQWPSRQGKVESGGTRAVLRVKDQDLPAKDTNFGYCPGGCGELRIEPGKDLSGFIGYAEFGDEEAIASMTDKTLKFDVEPYVCP